MRSIIGLISSEKFARIRVGFKPTEESRVPLINLVLSGISEQDKPLFEKAITAAANAAFDFASGKDIQSVMQKYNGKAQ